MNKPDDNGHYLQLAINWLTANESHWDNHPDYPVEDWQHEVAEGNTRQSYRDWILSHAEERDHDDDQNA